MASTIVLVACAICFGETDSPLLDAARAGVLTMAGLTVCVLGAFGRWFIALARRSRGHDDESA